MQWKQKTHLLRILEPMEMQESYQSLNINEEDAILEDTNKAGEKL